MAIVLVEQRAEVALALTTDAVVMERGRIVHRARSAELEVRAAISPAKTIAARGLRSS